MCELHGDGESDAGDGLDEGGELGVDGGETDMENGGMGVVKRWLAWMNEQQTRRQGAQP